MEKRQDKIRAHQNLVVMWQSPQRFVLKFEATLSLRGNGNCYRNFNDFAAFFLKVPKVNFTTQLGQSDGVNKTSFLTTWVSSRESINSMLPHQIPM